MRAARSAYSDAAGWIRSARPDGFRAGRWAARMVDGSLVVGIVVLGSIGLAAPSRFGDPGARPVRSGWPWFVLLGLVIACAALLVAHRRRIAALVDRVREPFVRPLDRDPAFEGAAGALAASPGPLRTRFALTWVWGPAVAFIVGAMLSFSAAYFAIDAILARFQVGWEQPVLGVANLVAAFIVLRSAASRLVTWRVACSALRDASGRY